MREQILDEVVARRFLLGQLSPDEQGRIEELAFDDPESFEVLQAAEDDLIDEFVYDDLSSEERERFQEYYLAQPGSRKDLRVANALKEYFEREQPVPSFWERLRRWIHIGASPLIPVMIKAAIIIGAAAIGLVALIPRIFGPGFNPAYQVQQQQPPALPSPTITASETPLQASDSPQPAHKDEQKKPPAPRRPPPSVLAILLSPGGPTRGGEGGTSVSLTTSRFFDFELPLIDNNSFRSYQATLEKDGQIIRTWSNLKPTKISSGNGIPVRVASNLLEASQRYRIALKGVDSNGDLQRVYDYYFNATP